MSKPLPSPKFEFAPLEFGYGDHHTVVFAPLMAEPPDLHFAHRWLGAFETSHRFTIFDPLSVPGLRNHLLANIDWESLQRAWAEELHGKKFAEAWGFSFGGCLLQKLANVPALEQANLIFLSTYSKAHSLLSERLEEVCAHLKAQNAFAALQSLELLITSEPLTTKPEWRCESSSLQRLQAGFRLLLSHDAHRELLLRKKRALFILGTDSRLMSLETLNGACGHRVRTIGSSQMRLSIEQPAALLRVIHEEGLHA